MLILVVMILISPAKSTVLKTKIQLKNNYNNSNYNS